MEGISEDHLAQPPVLTDKAKKEAGISYWPIENKNNKKCAMKINYVNYFVDGGYRIVNNSTNSLSTHFPSATGKRWRK